MVRIMIAVLDLKAQTFGAPQAVPSLGVGMRSLADEVNRSDPGNLLFTHPEDFVLYELGSFDDSTGLFVLHEQPRLVSQCSDYKR